MTLLPLVLPAWLLLLLQQSVIEAVATMALRFVSSELLELLEFMLMLLLLNWLLPRRPMTLGPPTVTVTSEWPIWAWAWVSVAPPA